MQYRDTVSRAYLSVQMIQHTRSKKHINRQEVKFVKMSGGLAKNNYASTNIFFPGFRPIRLIHHLIQAYFYTQTLYYNGISLVDRVVTLIGSEGR